MGQGDGSRPRLIGSGVRGTAALDAPPFFFGPTESQAGSLPRILGTGELVGKIWLRLGTPWRQARRRPDVAVVAETADKNEIDRVMAGRSMQLARLLWSNRQTPWTNRSGTWPRNHRI